MNDSESMGAPRVPVAGEPEAAGDLKGYAWRCALVFLAIVCTTSLMIVASFSNIGGWPLKVTVILAIAIVNASIVAGSLMHLLSEKRAVYIVLGFTLVFFAGLMGLTVWAMHDMPPGTSFH